MEISQSQRANNVKFHLHELPKIVKLLEQKVECWLPGARDGEIQLFMNSDFQFCKMKKFWRRFAQQYEYA